MTEYLMGGEWTPARAVRARLLRAATVLETSTDDLDLAMAKYVRLGWQAVASRPRDLDRLLARARELSAGKVAGNG